MGSSTAPAVSIASPTHDAGGMGSSTDVLAECTTPDTGSRGLLGGTRPLPIVLPLPSPPAAVEWFGTPMFLHQAAPQALAHGGEAGGVSRAVNVGAPALW